MTINLSISERKKIIEKILEASNENWIEGKRFVTKEGFKVRSKIEKIIADTYNELGIKIEYEKKIIFPKNDNSKYTIFCDFYLPEFDIYHEHFGMNTPDYLKKTEIKKKTFKKFKMKFFETSEKDETNIEKAIIDKLKTFNIEIK